MNKRRLLWLALALFFQVLAAHGVAPLILLSPGLLGLGLWALPARTAIPSALCWGLLFSATFHFWALQSGVSFWVPLTLVRGLPWLFFVLPMLAAHAYKEENPYLRALSVGTGLALTSQALLATPAGFDWELPAATLTAWPWTLTLLPWLGLSGTSFLLGSLSALLLQANKASVGAGLALLGLWLSANSLLSSPAQECPVSVALLQPGWSEQQKWDPRYVEVSKNLLFLMSRDGEAADLIVWPETAWPVKGLGEVEQDRRAISNLARNLRTDILAASIEVEPGGWRNTVWLVEASGQFFDRYDKQRLVPFGEHIPLPLSGKSLLQSIKPRSPEDRNYLASDNTRVFQNGDFRYSPLICFDSMVPWPSEKVAEQVDFLVVVTNDASLKSDFPKEAHFRSAILRALQFRLPIVQASNNGVTGIIDSAGYVTARTEPTLTGPQLLLYRGPGLGAELRNAGYLNP